MYFTKPSAQSNIARTTALLIACLLTLSCTAPQQPEQVAPIYYTPFNDKVDLSHVSMTATNLQLGKNQQGHRQVSFDYTVLNQSGTSIAFACLYNRANNLIEVNLYDAEGNAVPLARNPLDNLTLAKPKPLIIKAGETIHHYSKVIAPSSLEAGTPITIRIRLHTPSRYDELRSSLEAPLIHSVW